MMGRSTPASWIPTLLLAGLLAIPAQAETVTYLHTDLLGSVVLETDQNRNVVKRYEYVPYGLPRQAIADAPGYTGHVHDAGSGLVYMQQRYYDPEVGQFLSVDPVGVDLATGANFNRYWYADNNPNTFVDPDGRESIGILQMDRDLRAVLAGEMAPDEFQERALARAGGVAVGAVVLATVNSPVAAASSARLLQMSRVPAAYKIAAEGGKHSGWLTKNVSKQTPEQLRKTIRRLDRVIEKHREKIRNPELHMSRDEITPATIERARRDWARTISNRMEQRDIARHVLKQRTKKCTGSRIPGNC